MIAFSFPKAWRAKPAMLSQALRAAFLCVLRVLCDLNYSGSPAGGSRPQICLNLRNLRFLILAALSVGLCDFSFGGFWEARGRGVGCS